MTEQRKHYPIAMPQTADQLMASREKRIRADIAFNPQVEITQEDWDRVNAYLHSEKHPFAAMLGADRVKVFFQATTIAPEKVTVLPKPTALDITQTQTDITALQQEIMQDHRMFGSMFLDAATFLKLTAPTMLAPDLFTETMFQTLSNMLFREWPHNTKDIFCLQQLYPEKTPQELGVTDSNFPEYLQAVTSAKERGIDTFAQEAAYLRLLYPEKDFKELVAQDKWKLLLETLQNLNTTGAEKSFVALAFSMTILAVEKIHISPDGHITYQMPESTVYGENQLPIMKLF